MTEENNTPIHMGKDDFLQKVEGFREIAGEDVGVKFMSSKFIVYGTLRAVQRLFEAFNGANAKYSYNRSAQSYVFVMSTPRLVGEHR